MAKLTGKDRVLYLVAALCAWGGTLISFIINLFNVDPDHSYTPHLFGPHKAGAAGALTRVVDWLCYFTEWSNIAITISLTIILTKGFRKTRGDKFLHHTALVMITVTLIVNYLLLAAKEHPVGWAAVSNVMEHYVTPIIAILVFALAYPRKEWKFKTTLEIFYVAIAYILLTFVKGAITDHYPYGFMDVVTYGYIKVLITTVAILVFAWIIGLIFLALDKLLSRRV